VEFKSERLKYTLNDMRKFTGRQLLEANPTSYWHLFGGVLETKNGLLASQAVPQRSGPCPEDTCAPWHRTPGPVCMPVQVLAIFVRAVLGHKRTL
jgi:hypothetical protein